jgi:G3E family GTPase
MTMTDTPTTKIPILIVSGFLGAGKTTFIRDLIPRLAAGPRAPYVILNDFLNAAIDAHSLRGLGAEIKGLAAGCVCCDESNSLVDAILRIPIQIHPFLIIEANGTTDPYRLIEILMLTPKIRDLLGPILQVTIINEARWGKRWLPGDRYTERAQARTASVILTNRGEPATEKQQRKLRNDLLEINPHAPHLDFDSLAELLLSEAAAESLPAPDISAPMEHVHLHAAVRLEPPIMSEQRLREWLLSLPREILRIKGLARLPGTEMAYFNRTDDPLEAPRIVVVEANDDIEPSVVFIGPGLDQKSLLASFSSQASAPTLFKIF